MIQCEWCGKDSDTYLCSKCAEGAGIEPDPVVLEVCAALESIGKPASQEAKYAENIAYYVNEVERLQAELAQARAQVENEKWRPIETAPQDGTVIDIWIDDRIADVYWGKPHHECGEAGQYCDSCPSYDAWCDCFGYVTGPEGSIEGEPTHWKPRPSHPSTERQDG